MPAEIASIEVLLYTSRWHGAGEWPPSPMRLFQALLAGACLGRGRDPEIADIEALEWLGGCPEPVIAAPPTIPGRAFSTFVPNNDMDVVARCAVEPGKIRDRKFVAPALFTCQPFSFTYYWQAGPGGEAIAPKLEGLAHRLYQFGRGVDPAFARVRFYAAEEMAERLRQNPGQIWRPSPSGPARLRCPTAGTLASLRGRHAELAQRYDSGILRQPAPAECRPVNYSTDAPKLLFELRPSGASGEFAAWPLKASHGLAGLLRDAVATRLVSALPEQTGAINAAVVGRGADERAKQSRIQIIPLPSIGAEQTNPCIRRVAVRVPPACPIRVTDLSWALSGVQLPTSQGAVLVPTADDGMLKHYGLESASRNWETVTPIAIPELPAPRRADGTEYAKLQSVVCTSVAAALRHAGIGAHPLDIKVQKQPWDRRGERAEAFAAPPRFGANRLWHARVTLATPITGPLLLGDGRYLGLGLLRPVQDDAPAYVLSIVGQRPQVADAAGVTRACRRALMSLARDAKGNVPTLFSGHEGSSRQAASGQHRHVYLTVRDSDGDGYLDELIAIAPWAVDRSYQPERRDQGRFSAAVAKLLELRAGRAGLLVLGPAALPDSGDPVFATSKKWSTATPYQPTRHARRPEDWPLVAAGDLTTECARRGLPQPVVKVQAITVGPRGGAELTATLTFAVPVAGPILLGRSAHAGGGLFLAC